MKALLPVIRIPVEVNRKLRELAEIEGTSLSSQVNKALIHWHQQAEKIEELEAELDDIRKDLHAEIQFGDY